jgi:hypothetical protein
MKSYIPLNMTDKTFGLANPNNFISDFYDSNDWKLSELGKTAGLAEALVCS